LIFIRGIKNDGVPHPINQKNLIPYKIAYIMVTEDIDPFKDPERYMVDHILEYEKLWVLAYTPAFLLSEEVEMTQLKKDYFDKIFKRITENVNKNPSVERPRKTIIYMSESGLKSISQMTVTNKKEVITKWKTLAEYEKNHHEALEMHVISDEYLPSFSFILGEVAGIWGTRSPYDLLIEHRVGVTKDSLFSLESEKSGKSKWFLRLPLTKMPEEVAWVVNFVHRQAYSTKFYSWLSTHESELFSPPPKIAVISAMIDELTFYRKVLCKDSKKVYDRASLGSGRKEIGILFPNREYGGYSVSNSVAEIIDKNPTIDQFWFAGVAGGLKGEMHLLDVVIPNQIIQLTYEKILTEKPESPLKKEQRLITISNSTYVIVRTKIHEVDQELKGLAETLKEYVGIHPDEWDKRIKKYSELLGPEEKKYLFDLIDNRLPEIVVEFPIWSSDHNVNDVSFASQLATEFHVKAFDMESGGLASACQKFKKKFFVIRGVSDLADNVRDKDEINQRMAMVTTSAALEMLLNMLAEGKP